MDRLKETLDDQAKLAADPDYNHAGWRLGESDNVLDEVWERHERAMFDREIETTNYIRENWQKDDRLALVYIDRRNGSQVTQKIKTAEEIVDPQFQAHLRASNASGRDLFVGMNPLGPEDNRTKSNIAAVRHVYLDLDNGGKEAVDRIVGTPGMPTPHHILESSHGKYQAIWSVKEFTPVEAERLMRGMVSTYGADPAATDVSRVLRLPGFRNHKYLESHYVRDVAEAPTTHREYTPTNFPAFTEQIIRERAQGNQVNAGTGTQSHNDWAWTRRQIEKGVDPQTIMRQLAEMRQDKPNPLYYAQHTVENALRKSQQQGQSIGVAQF